MRAGPLRVQSKLDEARGPNHATGTIRYARGWARTMKHALALVLSSALFVTACSSPDHGATGAEKPVPPTSAPTKPDVPAPTPTESEIEVLDANAPLEGTEWRLVEVGGQSAVPGLRDRAAAVTFTREGGGVHGSSGINSFFGPYSVDGETLRIENLGMTRMAGPPELMKQESAFVAALHAARKWKVHGNSLELIDEKGVVIARLRAARAF